MVISMENKYLLAIPIAAISLLAVGLALAHENPGETNTPFGNMMGNGFGMGGMMNMMEMMGGDFAHDQDDIEWMREEMKEHMNFTDEEFDEMAEHCPMMRGR